MSKKRIVFLLGIAVAILPFLGFPSSWKTILFSAMGLFISYTALNMKKKTFTEKKPKPIPSASMGVFADNRQSQSSDEDE